MLTNKELDQIDGGAVRWGIGIAIGSVITLYESLFIKLIIDSL